MFYYNISYRDVTNLQHLQPYLPLYIKNSKLKYCKADFSLQKNRQIKQKTQREVQTLTLHGF
jgi:hypothetical protein